ncbi:MAG: hypothetical protein ACTHNG_17200 [Ginsengibacter sp.]
MQDPALAAGRTQLFILIFFTSLCWIMASCNAPQEKQHLELTQQIVKETIQRVLYPPSDTPVVKTKLDFHNVQIAKPRTAGQQKVWYFPDTTIVYPVLVKFTSTDRIQEGPNLPISYDIHDISQEYIFYKDEFGNWALKIVSGSENSDVERKHN